MQFGDVWRCLGPGAWHPLNPPWVPLPVPGAGKIYWGHGVRGLASPDPLVGAAQHVAGEKELGMVLEEIILQMVRSRSHRIWRCDEFFWEGFSAQALAS